MTHDGISARTQIRDGKRMSEFMRTIFLYLRSGSQMVNQNPQTILVEWSVGLADKEGGTGIIPILAANQITPNGFSGNFTQVNCTSFAIFSSANNSMPNRDFSSLEVDNVIVNEQGSVARTPVSINIKTIA